MPWVPFLWQCRDGYKWSSDDRMSPIHRHKQLRVCNIISMKMNTTVVIGEIILTISMKMFKYVNIEKLYSNMSTLCSKDGSPPRFPDEAPLMHQNYLVHVMMPLMMLQGIQVQKKGQYFDFSVTTKFFDVNACSQQVCTSKACHV